MVNAGNCGQLPVSFTWCGLKSTHSLSTSQAAGLGAGTWTLLLSLEVRTPEAKPLAQDQQGRKCRIRVQSSCLDSKSPAPGREGQHPGDVPLG